MAILVVVVIMVKMTLAFPNVFYWSTKGVLGVAMSDFDFTHSSIHPTIMVVIILVMAVMT